MGILQAQRLPLCLFFYVRISLPFIRGGVRRTEGLSSFIRGGVRRTQGSSPFPRGGVRRTQGLSPFIRGGVRRTQGSSPFPRRGVRRTQGSSPFPRGGVRRTEGIPGNKKTTDAQASVVLTGNSPEAAAFRVSRQQQVYFPIPGAATCSSADGKQRRRCGKSSRQTWQTRYPAHPDPS